MHLVTLSISSSAEITITGRPRSSELAFKCSSTSYPFVSAIMMSRERDRPGPPASSRAPRGRSRLSRRIDSVKRLSSLSSTIRTTGSHDCAHCAAEVAQGLTRRNGDGGMLKLFRCLNQVDTGTSAWGQLQRSFTCSRSVSIAPESRPSANSVDQSLQCQLPTFGLAPRLLDYGSTAGTIAILQRLTGDQLLERAAVE